VIVEIQKDSHIAVISSKNQVLWLEFKEAKVRKCSLLLHKKGTLMPYNFDDNSGHFLIKSDKSLILVPDNR
jgi:hypothetical protein